MIRALAPIAACLAAFASVVGAQSPAVSEEPYLRFSRELERSINAREAELLDGALDFDALMDRITLGLEVSTSARARFDRSLRTELRLGENLVAELEDGGSFRLLGMLGEEGRFRARFRVLSHGKLDYHEYLLARDHRGDIRIHDVFRLRWGEELSQTTARDFLESSSGEGQDFVARVLGGEDMEFAQNEGRIQLVKGLLVVRDFEAAWREFLLLPAALRVQKNHFFLRLAITHGLGVDLYLASLREFRAAYPEDAALLLLDLDGLFLENRHEEALASLDRLEQRVGEDPYLETLRGDLLLALGRDEEALARFGAAAAREPGLAEAYWPLVELAIDQGDYRSAIRALALLEERCGVDLARLEENPYFEDLVRSEAWSAWRAER